MFAEARCCKSAEASRRCKLQLVAGRAHIRGLHRCGSASYRPKPSLLSVTMLTHRCWLMNWPSMASGAWAVHSRGSCVGQKMTCRGDRRGGGTGAKQGGGSSQVSNIFRRAAGNQQPAGMG